MQLAFVSTWRINYCAAVNNGKGSQCGIPNKVLCLDRAQQAMIQIKDYDPKQQSFLNFVLSQYVKEGVNELDDAKLADLLKLNYGAIDDAENQLGPIKNIREAFIGFQGYLYQDKVS